MQARRRFQSVTASASSALLIAAGLVAVTAAPSLAACGVSYSIDSEGATFATFTGSGECTWTVPANVGSISAVVVGAGGGGGGGVVDWNNADYPKSGGGGGGGEVTPVPVTAVTPGETLTIDLGVGGSGGIGYQDGGDGTASSLTIDGTTTSAAGGKGGTSVGERVPPGSNSRTIDTTRQGVGGLSGSGEAGGGDTSAKSWGGGTGYFSQGGGGAGGPGGADGPGTGGRGVTWEGNGIGYGGGGGGGSITGNSYRAPAYDGGVPGDSWYYCSGDAPANRGGGGGGSTATSNWPATSCAFRSGPNYGKSPGGAGGSGAVVIKYVQPYMLVYKANGGIDGPASGLHYADSTVTVGAAPTLTGYTFNGWNTALDGGGTDYVAGDTFTMPSEDLTLYAQWTPVTYTVTYDLNGGGGAAPGSTDVDYGTSATVTSDVPTRDGYWFNGWNTAANGSGAAYAAAAQFVMLNNVTLHAQWVGNEFDLAYNANGGVGAPAAETRTVDSTAPLSAVRPTRTGYTFDEWDTNPSTGPFEVGADFTMPGADTVLFAEWTPIEYSLTYNANGGTGAPAAQSVDYLETLTIGAAPTRQGYAFTGWNSAQDGSGDSYAVGGSFLLTEASDTTLYAQWSPKKYKVLYDANGGTNTPFSEVDETGEEVTVTSVTPTRSGYSFDGWNSAANGSGTNYSPGQTFTMPGENVTLYARWSSSSGPGPAPGPAPEPTPEIDPSPTPQPSPSGEPSVDEPFVNKAINDLPAGEAIAYEGAQQIDIKVSPQVSNESQTVEGEDWSLTLTALEPDETALPLTNSGAVNATVGGSAQVSGAGFAPGTQVNVFIIGSNSPLGTFTVAPDGTFRGVAAIPRDFTAGNYAIQANGLTPNRVVRSTTIGIVIEDSAQMRTARLRTTVYFDARSAALDKAARRAIARLARSVPEGAQIVRVRSVGFVQPEPYTGNDTSLSKNRARNAVRELRAEGVRGPTRVVAKGRAQQQGPKARRATVTVVYRIAE